MNTKSNIRFLITAGPTREHLDPVRFLSNRSTGKMGFALAHAAAKLGCQTTLVAGPVALKTPKDVRRIDIVSARDMLSALAAEIENADVLIMAAAPADFCPAKYSEKKIKKADFKNFPAAIALENTPDILKTLRARKGEKIFIGFAAETGDPTAEAARKLREKGLDLIVANDVTEPGCGFAVNTNRVTLIEDAARAEIKLRQFPSPRNEIRRGLRLHYLPLMSKLSAAARIVDFAITRFAEAHQ